MCLELSARIGSVGLLLLAGLCELACSFADFSVS